MGQLFRRINRLIKSELNYSSNQSHTGVDREATAFVAGGALSGSSVGKIGILAGGNGFSIGAVPLGVAGALTGAALYEVIKALVEGDSSSMGAAAVGASAGAAVSAAIGNVGVGVGGTAFGVGMVPMAAAGAIAGLGIAGLNQLLQQGIDPEKLLDLAIDDMQEDLIKLRQSIVQVIVSQKMIQLKYNQAEVEVNKWQQYAHLALQKGEENLAREALIRKKAHSETKNSLKAQLDSITTQVHSLKQNLIAFESKVSEAKTLKYKLKAQLAANKAQLQLQNAIGKLGTSTAMSAFERMEERVLMMEARAHSAQQLTGNNLEKQFAALEVGSDVDDELMRMKVHIAGSAPNLTTLPGTAQSITPSNSAVDKDLEELKRQMDEL